MEKKDKLTIIVFIFLIISIIIVIGINIYQNRKLNNIDRKIEYIMGYTYDTVLNKGEKLFLQTIELFNNKNIFEYSKDLSNSVKYYVIGDKQNYLKINNFSIAKNNFSNNALEKYMEYKKIIKFENNYYIEDIKIEKNDFIGSIVEIDNYDNKKVYFNSTNYYCENGEYIGILEKTPNCNFTKSETRFSIELQNGLFKISDIEEFKLIVK